MLWILAEMVFCLKKKKKACIWEIKLQSNTVVKIEFRYFPISPKFYQVPIAVCASFSNHCIEFPFLSEQRVGSSFGVN